MGPREPDRFATQPQYEASLLRQLEMAMSSAAMLDLLRRDWPYSGRRGLILTDCQAVRVYPQDGKGFVLEYEMRFSGENGEKVERVFGELVGEQAEQRCAELIERLKKSRRKQLERKGSTDLVTCLPNLGLILRLSGLDEKLHGLKVALKSEALRPILSRSLSLGGDEVTECTTDILGHRLGKRCVIRCRFESRDPGSGRKVARSVIGKVYRFRDDRERHVFAAMRGLWEHGFGDGAEDGIRIPKPLAYVSDWQLLLMEDAPGSSLAGFERPALEPAIELAGRALAKLHRCPLVVPGRHTAADEVGLLTGWVAVVSQVHPVLKAVLEAALAEVTDALDRCQSFEPTLVHRDFYEKQVLVDGPRAILMDFDTLCLADPAIDVGNFLAHLRLASLQGLGRVERLEEAFLRRYHPGPSRDFSARVVAYTKSSLLRLACLYSLWPRQRHLTKPLLATLETVYD